MNVAAVVGVVSVVALVAIVAIVAVVGVVISIALIVSKFSVSFYMILQIVLGCKLSN